LRRKLNKIFYPKGKTAIKADYYAQLSKKATEEEIIKVFENFNFETNTSGYHSASSSIAPSTLRNAMVEAQKTLEVLLKKIESLDSATSKDKLNDLVE
jgi:hypothetical protein